MLTPTSCLLLQSAENEEALGQLLQQMGVQNGQNISFENFWALINKQAVQMFGSTHKEKNIKCGCLLQWAMVAPPTITGATLREAFQQYGGELGSPMDKSALQTTLHICSNLSVRILSQTCESESEPSGPNPPLSCWGPKGVKPLQSGVKRSKDLQFPEWNRQRKRFQSTSCTQTDVTACLLI